MSSKVIRVNKMESDLIEYLRTNDIATLKNEIEDCLTNEMRTNLHFHCELSRILRILQKDTSYEDTLIEDGFITEEQLNYLVSCIDKGKNIVIRGHSAVGKTVLLKFLMDYIKNKHLTIYDKFKEFEITDEMRKLNYSVDIRNEKMLDFEYLRLQRNKPNKTIIFGDVVTIPDIFSLLYCMDSEFATILTSNGSNEIDWKDEIVSDLDVGMQKYAKEILSQNDLVLVQIEIDRNKKRKVSGIKEIERLQFRSGDKIC